MFRIRDCSKLGHSTLVVCSVPTYISDPPILAHNNIIVLKETPSVYMLYNPVKENTLEMNFFSTQTAC